MPLYFSDAKLVAKPSSDVCVRIITDWPHPTDADNKVLFTSSEGSLLRMWIKQTGMSAFESCMEFVNLWPEAMNLDTIESRLANKSDPDADLTAGLVITGKYFTKAQTAAAAEVFADCQANPANITLVLGQFAGQLASGQKSFKLDRNRGATTWNNLLGGKCVYTYHPRHVRTKWKDYSLALMDTLKAYGESDNAEFNPPKGKVYVAENLADVQLIVDKLAQAPAFSVDIETMPIAGFPQIDCIGFAPTDNNGKPAGDAYVILLFDRFKLGRNTASQADLFAGRARGKYIGEWSEADEITVWKQIAKIMALPVRKIMQNGMYDSWNLWEVYGIPTLGGFDDTMIRHHCLYAELPKGLDMLGSLYTNYGAWKDMRQFDHKGT